jgi:general secretion pathway protein G
MIHSTLRRLGFTFLEIMLVVLIIGILVSIVAPRFAGRTRQGRVIATKMGLNSTETAVAEFEFIYSRYPESLEELLHPPESDFGGEPPEFFDTFPTDGWQHRLIYNQPAELGGRHYDLYSMGGNGVDDRGQGDDIVAWATDEDLDL